MGGGGTFGENKGNIFGGDISGPSSKVLVFTKQMPPRTYGFRMPPLRGQVGSVRRKGGTCTGFLPREVHGRAIVHRRNGEGDFVDINLLEEELMGRGGWVGGIGIIRVDRDERRQA